MLHERKGIVAMNPAMTTVGNGHTSITSIASSPGLVCEDQAILGYETCFGDLKLGNECQPIFSLVHTVCVES